MLTIPGFIKLVEKNLKDFTESPVFAFYQVPGLKEAAQRICLSKKSKRIRVDMLYRFGSPLEPETDNLVRLASSAELIHGASLLHDDVIDADFKRRSEPTINALHDNTIAVLLGDLLYSQALEYLHGSPYPVFQSAIQVVKEMTLSSLMEYSYRGSLELREADWEKIALGKTASLFAWCCSAAALSVNSEAVPVLREAGVLLGKAFQLADDIKDFFAIESFGKELYSDIKNKNPNYITILAVNSSEFIKSDILRLWELDSIGQENTIEIQKIGDRIAESAFFEDSVQRLKEWVAKGIDTLNRNGLSNAGKNMEALLAKVFASLPTEIIRKLKGAGVA